MEFSFSDVNFELIQSVTYPIIEQITGIDPTKWTGEKSELFIDVGDAFGDISSLFIVIGSALEDGKISMEEVEEIVAKSKSLPDAIDEIISFFEDEAE